MSNTRLVSIPRLRSFCLVDCRVDLLRDGRYTYSFPWGPVGAWKARMEAAMRLTERTWFGRKRREASAYVLGTAAECGAGVVMVGRLGLLGWTGWLTPLF